MRGYLDGDTLAAAADAIRNGQPIEVIANHLSITVADLQRLLGQPQWKQPVASDEVDLWQGVDRLQEVL
jgi:hypothetical protein